VVGLISFESPEVFVSFVLSIIGLYYQRFLFREFCKDPQYVMVQFFLRREARLAAVFLVGFSLLLACAFGVMAFNILNSAYVHLTTASLVCYVLATYIASHTIGSMSKTKGSASAVGGGESA
jgi:hypothetical protein